MTGRIFLTFISILTCASCTKLPVSHAPEKDLGLLWVKHAAEYDAVSRQVYQAAELALPKFIADESWSALPWQVDAGHLPAAVILDLDQTVLNGVDFQLTYERPFSNEQHENWSRETTAVSVPGFSKFAAAAMAAGVDLFFVTNRPCESAVDNSAACPQEITAIQDVSEVGINADADHVMLAYEHADWTKEKGVRRDFIAKTHRVIMVIGDDLSDFIPCVRLVPATPCTESATAANRDVLVSKQAAFWGNGWYILPNPIHGSWTTMN